MAVWTSHLVIATKFHSDFLSLVFLSYLFWPKWYTFSKCINVSKHKNTPTLFLRRKWYPTTKKIDNPENFSPQTVDPSHRSCCQLWTRGQAYDSQLFCVKDERNLRRNSSWVVSAHLKNMSQIGSSPQVGMNIKRKWNHHLEFIPGPSSFFCAKRFLYFEQKSPSLWVAFGTCLGRWLVESYWETLQLSTSHDAGVTMKSMNHVTGTSDGEHWNDQNLIHDNTTVHFWSQYMQLILWPNGIPCECVFLFVPLSCWAETCWCVVRPVEEKVTW